MVLKALNLPIKKEYFDQIKSGEKKVEYRVMSEFWRNRIQGKKFSKIVITCGYPKKGDDSRRLERPWRGCKIEKIEHPEFDNIPVWCYCIVVNEED